MKHLTLMKALLLSAVTLGAPGLQAHTKLESAVPADGAVLREPPQTLELSFSEEVQLLKLDIATDEGVALDAGFTPGAEGSKTFSIQLPELAPEAYVVGWTVLGADGHRVEGTLGFLLDPTAHEPADSAGENATP